MNIREQIVEALEKEPDKKFIIQEALTWIEGDCILSRIEKSKMFGEKGNDIEKICEIILNDNPYKAYVPSYKLEEIYESKDLPFTLSQILYLTA